MIIAICLSGSCCDSLCNSQSTDRDNDLKNMDSIQIVNLENQDKDEFVHYYWEN